MSPGPSAISTSAARPPTTLTSVRPTTSAPAQAYTSYRPGLIGPLLVGLSAAKPFAFVNELPLIGVHHIEGHLASALLGDRPLELPFLGLVVSGGHTQFYRVQTLAELVLLGQTRDDAAGEAFDKIAKRMGLGYPGGREIDERARSGNGERWSFPRPMLRDSGLEMSFSGLKTAVSLAATRCEEASGGVLGEGDIADLAASFQEAVCDVLIEKAQRALDETGLSRIAVVGGLAANSRLRERMAALASERGLEVRFPAIRLCTDNAAMIGAVADGMLRAGRVSSLDLEAFSRVPLGTAGATP